MNKPHIRIFSRDFKRCIFTEPLYWHLIENQLYWHGKLVAIKIIATYE